MKKRMMRCMLQVVVNNNLVTSCSIHGSSGGSDTTRRVGTRRARLFRLLLSSSALLFPLSVSLSLSLCLCLHLSLSLASPLQSLYDLPSDKMSSSTCSLSINRSIHPFIHPSRPNMVYSENSSKKTPQDAAAS